jgi:hypothetical protein
MRVWRAFRKRTQAIQVEEGLNVELDEFQMGSRVVESVLAGISDFAYGPYSLSLLMAPLLPFRFSR